MLSTRRLRFLLRKLLRTLGRATGTAHQIAMGVAIGFFVGWLPIIGIQMAVAVVVCTLFRANKVVPIFPIWLTNPVTMVPIYSFNYWVGWVVVGGPPLTDLAAILKKMITPPEAAPDVGRFTAWWEGVKHAFTELLSMGWEMQVPLWLGCVIVGLALAIPSYYLSYKFVVAFREAVAKKRQLRQELRRRASGMDVNIGGTYNRSDWTGAGGTAADPIAALIEPEPAPIIPDEPAPSPTPEPLAPAESTPAEPEGEPAAPVQPEPVSVPEAVSEPTPPAEAVPEAKPEPEAVSPEPEQDATSGLTSNEAGK